MYIFSSFKTNYAKVKGSNYQQMLEKKDPVKGSCFRWKKNAC